MSELVIALDQGSSSSRALAIDSRGRVVARVQRPVATSHPRAGWFEHDAGALAASAEKSLDRLLDALPARARLAGMGIACQRSTIVLWDGRTGRPVAPALSWQDGRAADIVSRLALPRERVHRRTGLYATPFYSAPKIRWLLERSLALRGLMKKGRLCAGPVASFLLWRLTGGRSWACDPTLAQRTLLFNIDSGRWDEELLAAFGVPRAILPDILPSRAGWGAFRRRGREIAVGAVVGDQQAAAAGLGALTPGSTVINYGTGAFLLRNAGPGGRSRFRIPGLLASLGPDCVFQEGTVHAAGTSLDWLKTRLRLIRNGDSVDVLCGRAKGPRVWALPAIGGLGAPRWDYVTKTAFFGLTSQTRAEDLVRAVVEGLAFQIADIAAALAGGGLPLKRVRAAGGLSRIEHLLRFQADLLGVEIERCRESEATALGAGSLAAEQAGLSWARRLREPTVDKVFRPRIGAAERSRLLRDWTRFVAAQSRLSRELAPPALS